MMVGCRGPRLKIKKKSDFTVSIFFYLFSKMQLLIWKAEMIELNLFSYR